MSGLFWFREIGAVIYDFVYSIFGWLIIAPIAAAVPKQRNWVAVIGRENGQFLDNSKYFFLQASTNYSKKLRVVHVTGQRTVCRWITDAGFSALSYPSFAGCWYLARCGTVVVDSVEWIEVARYFLLIRARKIQLWHGVAFKRIELDKWRKEADDRRLMSASWILHTRMLRKRLRGRIPKYDAIITTSTFYRDNQFTSAFRSRHVLTTGYPRNCFGKTGNTRADQLALINVDRHMLAQLPEWRNQNKKIILVAPTFRDTRATPLGLDKTMQERLDVFCDELGFEFLFKFHPYEKNASDIHGRHLHLLDTHSDLYPLLPDVHTLITDYSSIYTDFLHLNRRILFFAPDLTQYISHDRDLQFDFDAMTPGPKLQTWGEILGILRGGRDDWEARRAEHKRLAFDDQTQLHATTKLLNFIYAQGWIV